LSVAQNIRNFVFLLAAAGLLAGCSVVPSRDSVSDYLFGADVPEHEAPSYPNRRCYAVAMQRAHDVSYTYPGLEDAVFRGAYQECNTGPER
jgi:hypothetical protein